MAKETLMKLCGPFTYRIAFTREGITSVEGPEGQKNFSGQGSLKSPKLYIISNGNKPLYVGATKRRVSDRLRDGFKASGEHGYYGYDWRRTLTKANFDIWVQVEGDIGTIREIETVEAEVVFLIRKGFGQWPAHQTEIHFHPSEAIHREEARKIVDHYWSALCPTG